MTALILFDRNAALVQEWNLAFRDFVAHGQVTIRQADLDYIVKTELFEGLVSPANSFGIMDGGIDQAITEAFPRVQENVTKFIQDRWSGYMPMGASSIVPTGDEAHPYLVVAPTMPYPMRISPFAIYNVMRSILAECRFMSSRPRNFDLRTLAISGLGTATGRVAPGPAAAAMAMAYRHHRLHNTAARTWAEASPIIAGLQDVARQKEPPA